ncbi:hypothetical protein EGW08_002554 [Elysia chlorotica]|uniref:Uncharacterized protein n=1 Tax=Elysia chlorotica TaxID=188477 RepID=A0A3S1CDH8_ELYCH|nr:hypothetical protein EGW08_002554 [Elysia chlorotica]
MVATSSSQQTIYRSVPPRLPSFGLSDMLDPRSLGYMGGRLRSSTAPISSNTPEEFAHRFKARPTTRPRIIEFDGSSVTPKGRPAIHQHPAVSNGFPTTRAKIYIGQLKARSPTDLTETQLSATAASSRSQHSSGRLHLTPLHSSPSILVGGGGTGGGASSTSTALHSSHGYHINHASPSPAPLPAAHVTHKALQGQNQQRQDKGSVVFSGSTAGSTKTSHHNHQQQQQQQQQSTTGSGSLRMLSKSASSLGQHGTAGGGGGGGGGRSSASGLKPSDSLRETSQSTDLVTSLPHDLHPELDHIHNPELLLTSSADCDDICALPPPKKVLPKRELPWVFRYKVKRGMNTLSRIMASKPPQSALHPGQAFT